MVYWFNKPVGLDSLFIIKIGQDATNIIGRVRKSFTPAQKLEYAKPMVEERYSN